MDKIKRYSKRILVGFVGGLVILIGIVLIPYPGPGWLTVFAGFAILSTEFEFAKSVLKWLKEKYDLWLVWLKKQHGIVQIGMFLFTSLVVAVTVWLINGFGAVNYFLQLHQDWLNSPLFH
ncbi:MAG: TIGR02611 family protein [Candidatus Saccharimonadales bacterium]